MITWLWRFIDRVTIDAAAAAMPKPDGRDLHVDEARHLLQDLDLFPDEIKTPALEFDPMGKFRFASPRPSAHAVNDTVVGRFYSCGEDWQQKPAALLLHGWNDALNHYYHFPRHARRLNRLGLNAVTVQLPWHYDRRPRDLGPWSNFISADLLRTVEAFRQALAEIRALVRWLLAEGCPSVGLWGISLGGLLTGLTICHDPRIGFAALTVPVARLDRAIEEVKFCKSIRDTLHGQPVDLRKLTLVSNMPMIDKSRILLVEAEHDLFVPKDSMEELWHAWNEPEIWRYPRGHITVLGTPGLAERTTRWIAAKASEPVAK